jgi:iron complex transport system permease protein
MLGSKANADLDEGPSGTTRQRPNHHDPTLDQAGRMTALEAIAQADPPEGPPSAGMPGTTPTPGDTEIQIGGRPTRQIVVLGTLAALLLVAFVANLGAGAVTIAPGDVIEVLAHHAGIGNGSTPRFDAVVWDIRLPRALLAALVGAALAVAGAALQAVFRNPLAEPSIIGVANGAAVGAVMVIVTGVAFAGVYTVPAAAFVGGLVATGVVFLVATQDNRIEVVTLVLAGIAVNVTAAAATGLFTYLADDDQLRDIVFWMLGSLAGATWTRIGTVAVPILLAAVVLCSRARSLDLLALGDREAGHLGINVTRMRVLVVALAALATGSAVAVAGVVGFVGLVVPHMVRLVAGPDHRTLLPASVVGGAALLLMADLAARTLVVPSELPLGVVTALAGGPYFLWLIRRQRTADGGWL